MACDLQKIRPELTRKIDAAPVPIRPNSQLIFSEIRRDRLATKLCQFMPIFEVYDSLRL
jgi:hypothetical protein